MNAKTCKEIVNEAFDDLNNVIDTKTTSLQKQIQRCFDAISTLFTKENNNDYEKPDLSNVEEVVSEQDDNTEYSSSDVFVMPEFKDGDAEDGNV